MEERGLPGDVDVSRLGQHPIATRLIAHMATTYQAGDIGSPVAAISQVTTNCVVPPNTVVPIA